jgi:hypothetical protein
MNHHPSSTPAVKLPILDMTGGMNPMIPNWMNVFGNDTYTYAAFMMLLSGALIGINDWYSKRKAHRAQVNLKTGSSSHA